MKITEGKPFRRGSDGRWCATYSIDGKRSRVYGTTRREAIEKRTLIIDRVRQGAPARDSRATVRQYVEGWLTTTLRVSGRSISTQALYTSQLEHHVMPILGDLRLSDVTPQEIEGLLLTLGERLSASTVRVTYSALRAVFDTAVRDGFLASNPVAKVKAPRPRQPEAKFLDHEQVGVLVKGMQGHRLEPLFLLILGTGLRRGEALGLRWSDLEGDRLHVRQSVRRIEGHGLIVSGLKRDRYRSGGRPPIILGEPLVKVLTKHRARQAAERLGAGPSWADADLMFTTPIGTMLEPRNVLRDFQVLAKTAGLGQIRLHTLRHTAASVLLAAGVDIATVREQLDHASKVITLNTYSHAMPSARQAAADILAAQIGGA